MYTNGQNSDTFFLYTQKTTLSLHNKIHRFRVKSAVCTYNAAFVKRLLQAANELTKPCVFTEYSKNPSLVILFVYHLFEINLNSI